MDNFSTNCISNFDSNYPGVSSLNNLVDCLEKETSLYIYGAGEIGYCIAKLFYQMQIEIKAFIVDDKYINSHDIKSIPNCFISEGTENVPVLPLTKVLSESKNPKIFVALKESSSKIVREKLQEKGIQQIYYYQFVSNNETDSCNALFKMLRRAILKTKLKMHQINTEEKNIRLNGKLRFINPLRNVDSYQDDFSIEANDLLFPSLFDDFSIVDEGPYEIENVRIESGDIVIDSGANIGLFSLYAASKGAHVHSFEPINSTFQKLTENVSLNNYNISLQKKGLSNTNGVIDMKLNSVISGGNTFVMDCPFDKTESIETTTLDDYVNSHNIKNVDFIKADIEGAERFMLMGAKDVLLNLEPKLAIATYHLEDDSQILENIIKDINPRYTIKHKWKKLYAYVQ